MSDGHRFHWIGISAFRLAELIAHGRESEAVRFLDWAASQRLTVVRVFAMAHHLFKLTPAEGLAAMPRLLELAAGRGLHVEIVALVDTTEIDVDFEQHVKALGALAADHENAILEIANEPWHPTQKASLHDPGVVRRLADLVPPAVPVALGSAERDDGYAAGDFVTWHSPRGGGSDGWQHVLELADGAGRVARWGRAVVSDEPIGAGPVLVAGRRDDTPARFGAAAVVTRLAGLSATFHYEGGLRAEIPAGPELACFTAWRSGLDLTSELPEGGRFMDAPEVEPRAAVHGARAAFAREFPRDLWVAAVDPSDRTSVTWRGGWALVSARDVPGVRLFHARR